MLANRSALLYAALGAAAVTIPLTALNLGHVPWAVSRASGLVAFAVLSLSVVLGLLISTRATGGLIPKALAFEMHQFLSVVSLALIGVHAGALLFDGFLSCTPAELLIPFESPYRRLSVGIGVIGAWLTAITTASFWVRTRIGVARWRRLHYFTFGAYVLSLFHGIWAGTDTALPVVYWMYVLSVAAVASLLTLRLGESAIRPPRAAKPPMNDRPGAGVMSPLSAE